MKKWAWAALILGALAGPVAAKTGDNPTWVRAFAAPPMWIPRATELTMENQTVRFPVRLSAGGSQLSIRLSGEHDRAPVAIAAASIKVGGGFIPLHFSGGAAVTLTPGAAVVSDPVTAKVQAGQIVELSLYIAQPALLSTIHRDPMNAATISQPGDFTQKADLLVATTTVMRPFLAAVDVLPDRPMRTIVAFGDSISDWDCAYTAGECQWELTLQRRLDEAGKPYAVANVAISASRVLKDGPPTPWSSLSAEARFDRDALSVPNVAYIVFMQGVNDIGLSGPNSDPAMDSPVVSADALIDGYKRLIARAHARGIRVYAAEILPFSGNWSWSADKEAVRQKVNAWIRTGGAFDGVVDFQKAVADPADPTKLAKGFDNGDHLHPSAAGQRAMGEAVDLKLFQ
ncbi:MAG TPA: SGNH/GDSL hydrolase family protein [Asticcacaulis sp.]|nr:SGNH/GDSL hydrolase family protein [Asticcacaulis sp.]